MSSKENTTEQVGLRTYIDGNGPTIIFVHGWPDDHTLWDKQVAHLKDRFRCVTVDLPGFGPDDRGVEKWGYTLDEVVKRLERTVEKEGNGKPIILVAHDWGCFYSLKFEAKRPELVRKMVTVDVGGAKHPGVIGTLLVITYQFWLAAAFLLGWPIGNVIARFFAGLFAAPSGARMARASTCYPYYQTLKLILSGREKIKPMYTQCPLMFVYGTAGLKKVLTFHAPKWAENVSKKDGCRVHPMTESSHWVMRDQSDEFNRKVDEFVTDT